MPSQSNAFVIPEGIQLELTEAGLSIEHDGDIIIDGGLNVGIERILSRNGDVHVGRSMQLAEIHAENGAVQIEGDLRIGKLLARRVETAGNLEADTLSITGGDLNVVGDLLTGELAVKGGIRVGGRTEAANVSTESDASFGSGLECSRLSVAGSLLLGGPTTAKVILVNGKDLVAKQSVEAVDVIAEETIIKLEGDAQIQLLRGREITIRGNENKIKAIQAQQRVSISEGMIMSDVLLAPNVEMHPQARGRIMVVETEGVLGPHSVKGCLQLEDLAPLIPDPNAFLLQRGVNHIGSPPPPREWADEQQEEAEEAAAEPAEELLEEPAEELLEEPAEELLEEPAEELPEEPAEELPEEPAEELPEEPAEELLEEPAEELLEEPAEELPVAIVEEDADGEAPEDGGNDRPDDGEDAPSGEEDGEEARGKEASSEEEGGEINLTSPIDFEDDEELFPEEEDHVSGGQKATVILHSVLVPGDEGDEAVMGPDDTAQPEDLEEEPLVQEGEEEQEGVLDPGSVEDPFLADIMAETNNIIASYDGAKPEALGDLVELIQTEDYENLREEMKNIWSKLLKHHQKNKTRIPGQVILSFNHINSRLNQL